MTLTEGNSKQEAQPKVKIRRNPHNPTNSMDRNSAGTQNSSTTTVAENTSPLHSPVVDSIAYYRNRAEKSCLLKHTNVHRSLNKHIIHL